MRLSPDVLVATYEYLRATPPFNGWSLPHSDDIVFVVGNSRKMYGHHLYEYGPDFIRHTIELSEYVHKNHDAVRQTMAHEMVHVYQRVAAHRERKRESAEHGRLFKVLAAKVCRAHGFDPVTF